MFRSLTVTDSRIWNAETEYAVAVAEAEAAMGAALIAAPCGSPARPEPGSSVEFVELPGVSPSSSPADFTANVRALSHLVGGGDFDVVHSSRPTAHIMAALATGSRAPLVHLRGSASVPSMGAANRFLYCRATDAVVVSSSRVQDWIVERLGVPAERVRRLLAPVAASWFEDPAASGATDGSRALAAELGVPPDSKIVLNVARLAPVKGHDVLLQAMSRVAARAPDAVLVLVGEPWSGQPEGLASRARDLGIEKAVVFAGRREDVGRFVAAAAVCVTSSIGSEENSRAVSEYMAAGRPVVATGVGVIPELVVEGATGFVVPPGEPLPLAEAVSALLDDTDLASRMGAAGRQEARERFSQDAFARGLTEVLESVGAVS